VTHSWILAQEAYGHYYSGDLLEAVDVARFHEGNAYTHLHDVPAALKAQDRALELCAPGDYTDRAMTRLDRARCLTDTGDMSAALAYATETLTTLTERQRQGIITLRGYEVLNGLPKVQKVLSAARDLRDLLMFTTE
jgi:hypothetical protein